MRYEGSLKVDFIEYARKWVDDNRDKHGIKGRGN